MVVVVDRLGYSMTTDWVNCDSNFDHEEHNFGGFGLANIHYYYYQNYSVVPKAYLISKAMDNFEQHRKHLHSPCL